MSGLTCIDSFWLNWQRTIASAPWRRLWATSGKFQRNFKKFPAAFRGNNLGGRVMSQQPNHIYEFGSFRLDVAERMLLREGEAIPLQLKAFDLLHVLVEHHGHLLEKDELLNVVWPDTIVEEVNLANNISVLRKALGEDGNGQRFIETVPRRGYRFVFGVRQTGAAAYAGQWRKAQDFSRRAIEMTERGDTQETAARYATEQALRGAVFGDCRQAKVNAAQGLKLARGRISLSRAALAFALCDEAKQAQSLVSELTEHYPEDTVINSLWLPMIRAALELQRGNAARAIDQLQAASRYEAAAEFWPQHLRGQAYLKLGRGAEATTEFQRILDHRGYAPLSPLYPLAHFGLARAAALRGDTARSRKAYEDFFAVWKEADADLQTLIAAKKEYEKIK